MVIFEQKRTTGRSGLQDPDPTNQVSPEKQGQRQPSNRASREEKELARKKKQQYPTAHTPLSWEGGGSFAIESVKLLPGRGFFLLCSFVLGDHTLLSRPCNLPSNVDTHLSSFYPIVLFTRPSSENTHWKEALCVRAPRMRKDIHSAHHSDPPSKGPRARSQEFHQVAYSESGARMRFVSQPFTY